MTMYDADAPTGSGFGFTLGGHTLARAVIVPVAEGATSPAGATPGA